MPTPRVLAALATVLALTRCSLPNSLPRANTPAEPPFQRPPAEGVRLEPTASGPLSGRTIVVDPGHAGTYDRAVSGHLLDMGLAGSRPCYTSGTTALDGTPEHSLNYAVGGLLATELRARGATVVMTRGDDEGLGPCNDDRARVANRVDADLLVSIHGDGDAEHKRGYHIIYAPNMAGGDALTERSRQAALVLALALRTDSPLPPANYKGTPDAPIDPRTNLGALSLLEDTPGVLVELGNLKNADDWRLLNRKPNREKTATALADGVVRALG